MNQFKGQAHTPHYSGEISQNERNVRILRHFTSAPRASHVPLGGCRRGAALPIGAGDQPALTGRGEGKNAVASLRPSEVSAVQPALGH